jgi:hypothetical protein
VAILEGDHKIAIRIVSHGERRPGAISARAIKVHRRYPTSPDERALTFGPSRQPRRGGSAMFSALCKNTFHFLHSLAWLAPCARARAYASAIMKKSEGGQGEARLSDRGAGPIPVTFV